MKQKIVCLVMMLMACCLQANLFAQKQQDRSKQMSYEQRIEKQAQNIANSLMLSDGDEAKFVPVYQQYLKDLRSCSRSDFHMDFNKSNFNRENMTDEQIDKMIQIRFDKCRKILDVREKYYEKFKTILSPKQIMKMYSIERSFGKKMQYELEKRYNKKRTK